MSRVFLSYSQEDLEFARRLNALFVRDGVDCFFDRDSIPPGADWVESLERAIQEADVLVLVLTPSYLQSRWTQTERNAAMAATRVGKTLIPLLFKDCKLPGFLSHIQSLDVRPGADFDDAYKRLCSRLGVTSRGQATPFKAAEFPTEQTKLSPVMRLPSRYQMPYRSMWNRFVGYVKARLRSFFALAVIVGAMCALTWWAISLITLPDSLIAGFGIGISRKNILDGELQVSFHDCEENCLAGVRKSARLRGGIGKDGFAVLNFWKLGALFGSDFARFQGNSLVVRFAGEPTGLGVEISVKDSENDEARFACIAAENRRVEDYLLPEHELRRRGVDLSRIKLLAIGPSSSAGTQEGRFRLEVLGVVAGNSTSSNECKGLLK